MPAVCKFFLKGYCRYGRNCRFEHPGENDNYFDDYKDSNYNNQQPSVANFSFKTGTSQFSGNNFNNNSSNSFSFASNNQNNNFGYQSLAAGFSFRQPIQGRYNNQNNNPHDVDMSEGFSFRQSQLGNIYGQTQNTLLQNNFINNNNGIFGSSNQQQSSFSFASQNNIFNQQRSPFEQTQIQNTPINNNFVDNNNSINNNIISQGETFKKSEFRELNELTEAELDAFKRDKFEFGRIPIKPPPKALC